MMSKIYKNLKISETIKIGSGGFGDKIYVEYFNNKNIYRGDIYADCYSNKYIKIVDIVTSERNKGYGTKLMNHFLFILKNNHNDDFEISCDMWIEENQDDNKNRKRFFEKFGFSVLKGHDGRYIIRAKLRDLNLYLSDVLKNDLYKLNINNRDISYFRDKMKKCIPLRINQQFVLIEKINKIIRINDIVGVCGGCFDGFNWIDILKNKEYISLINKIVDGYKNNKITKDQIISNIKLINYKSDIFDFKTSKLEDKYFIENEINSICYFVIVRFFFIQDKTNYREEFNIESRLYKKSVQTKFENLEKISKNLNRSKKLKNTFLLKIKNNEFCFEVEVQKLFFRKRYRYSFEEESLSNILIYADYNFLNKLTIFLNSLLLSFLDTIYYLFYPVFFILEKILKK